MGPSRELLPSGYLGAELIICISAGSHPIPFECNITPRFPEVTAILELEKELLEGTELL
jgi:hypothetical protein